MTKKALRQAAADPIPTKIILTDMKDVPLDGEEIILDETVRAAIAEVMKKNSLGAREATEKFILDAIDHYTGA